MHYATSARRRSGDGRDEADNDTCVRKIELRVCERSVENVFSPYRGRKYYFRSRLRNANVVGVFRKKPININLSKTFRNS